MVTGKQLPCLQVVALAVMALLSSAGKVQLTMAALNSFSWYLKASKLQRPSGSCPDQPAATTPLRRTICHPSEADAVSKVCLRVASLPHDKPACSLWVRQLLAPAAEQGDKRLLELALCQPKAEQAVQSADLYQMRLNPRGKELGPQLKAPRAVRNNKSPCLVIVLKQCLTTCLARSLNEPSSIPTKLVNAAVCEGG